MQKIPTKQELTERYDKRERIASYFSIVVSILIPVLIVVIDWNTLFNGNLETIIVIGVSLGPTVISLLTLFVTKKKLIQNLKDNYQFGVIYKSDLIEICKTALKKLNLELDNVNFYITGEKQLNAYALALGFGDFFPKKKTVFINKSTLFALDKSELLTIVGHELAHLYKYPQNYHRWFFLYQIFTTLFLLTIWSFYPNIIIVLVSLGILQWLITKITLSDPQDIEFLCDDFGAEVGGLENALKAEYKIATYSEILSQAVYKALLLKAKSNDLSLKKINAIINDSLSYEFISNESVEKELNSRITTKLKNNKQSFFSYFIALFNNDDYSAKDYFEQELKSYKILENYKKIDLSVIDKPKYSIDWFIELRRILINKNANEILFLTPHELSDQGASHPSNTRRIQYLTSQISQDRES